MKIIVSPAKKMKRDTDFLSCKQLPLFLEKSEKLFTLLKKKSYNELKALWKCNDSLATLNFNRLQDTNLYEAVTPAIIAFQGIQYQYMGTDVFTTRQYAYLENHLRILSGLYGILRPFDGVQPYRLEMQSRLQGESFHSLYEFWNDRIAKQIQSETHTILNLASKEYSKTISRHLQKDIKFVTCVFGEIRDGKVIEKGTLAKMARGEMVRFLAENEIVSLKDVPSFDRLGYTFSESFSDQNTQSSPY
ncbi:MAG TPA: peroxide stress protein YaaA [Eubacteriaceae bacterium]|nr:peroxide stress protein YaaA [Eubacteriaceae bacterium]